MSTGKAAAAIMPKAWRTDGVNVLLTQDSQYSWLELEMLNKIYIIRLCNYPFPSFPTPY